MTAGEGYWVDRNVSEAICLRNSVLHAIRRSEDHSNLEKVVRKATLFTCSPGMKDLIAATDIPDGAISRDELICENGAVLFGGDHDASCENPAHLVHMLSVWSWFDDPIESFSGIIAYFFPGEHGRSKGIAPACCIDLSGELSYQIDPYGRTLSEDESEAILYSAVDALVFALVANERIAAKSTLRGTGLTVKNSCRKAKVRVPEVTVTKLRREYEPPGELIPRGKTGREYSHRWHVRSHWREQPCGPGRSLRKRILIPSYIKGPADKPMVFKERLYALER